MEIIDVIIDLENQLVLMKRTKEPMDEANWNYQKGVLISGEEAQIILNKLKGE